MTHMSSDDYVIGKRMCEDMTAEAFASDFPKVIGRGFSEIWLMDDGMKYTSRRDPRAPADFFCFAPSEQGRVLGA
jgi:hypothetical protein